MRKTEQFEIPYIDFEIAASKPSKTWKFIYEWLDSLIFAFITILIVFTFCFRIVGVSGESMVPTLQNGDWLAVRAINTSIDRGDIVVITQPNSLHEPLIKRVIAVGGDTVDIDFVEGTVTVNGEVLPNPISMKLHTVCLMWHSRLPFPKARCLSWVTTAMSRSTAVRQPSVLLIRAIFSAWRNSDFILLAIGS